jgi:RNA polymerase sigma-70 factor (ECF subfamily)
MPEVGFTRIIQPVDDSLRLFNVTVAELTIALSSRAARAMADTSFDAETTQLVVRARAGDRDAFGALVDLHHRAARRVAAAALGNLADADEAVQDACLTAWRRLDRLDDPSAFRAWLLRITWRKAIDQRRSLGAWVRRLRQDHADPQQALDSLPSNASLPETELLTRERDRVLAQLIQSLPARLRDPFLLAATGEHRYEDIATLLGVPLGTVKWRMLEARRLLREKLERVGFGEGS